MSLTTSIKGTRAAAVVLLTVMFSVPFASGSPWHYVYGFAFLSLFPLWVWCLTRKSPISILATMKQFHPLRFYLLVALAVSSFISWANVVMADVAIEQKALATVRYIACWLLVFYSFMLARLAAIETIKPQSLFALFAAGALVLVSLLAGIHYFFAAPNAENWGIDPPVGTHVRVMGMIASIAIVSLTVRLWMLKQSMMGMVLAYLSLFILCGFLVWTGSRMSIIAVMAVVLLLAVLCRLWHKTAWLKIAAVMLLALLSVWPAEKMAIYEWSGLQRAVKVTAISAEKEQTVENLADQVSSGRVAIWAAALNAAKSAPWFGLGPFGYYFVEDRPERYEHTHNLLIEFIVEWGVIGALLLSGFLLSLLWPMLFYVKKAVTQGNTAWLSVASVLLVLNINALTDGVYFIFIPSVMLATSYALLWPLKLRGHTN